MHLNMHTLLLNHQQLLKTLRTEAAKSHRDKQTGKTNKYHLQHDGQVLIYMIIWCRLCFSFLQCSVRADVITCSMFLVELLCSCLTDGTVWSGMLQADLTVSQTHCYTNTSKPFHRTFGGLAATLLVIACSVWEWFSTFSFNLRSLG